MVKSVYKGGSSVVLPNPSDIDYFYYYKTNKERVKALENNSDHTVDNHYKMWGKRLNIFLGCYAYPFMEHISGEEIPEFKEFNVCEHKEEYIEKAKFFVENM